MAKTGNGHGNAILGPIIDRYWLISIFQRKKKRRKNGELGKYWPLIGLAYAASFKTILANFDF